MKYIHAVLFLTLILTSGLVVAQGKLDTLKLTKDQYTLVEKKNGTCFYKEGNKFVINCPTDWTKLMDSKVLSTTKPYVLALYFDKDYKHLFAIGEAHANCYTGGYQEFSESGKKLIEGMFTAKDSLSVGDCNLKNGEWTYYDEKGRILRKEVWQKGAFVGKKGWDPLPVHGVEVQVNGVNYENKPISIAGLTSLKILLQTKDYDDAYGRFECRLMVTGGRAPLKQLTLDYSTVKYFDFKKFLEEFWKPGSDLFFEMEDKKTNTYLNFVLKLEK